MLRLSPIDFLSDQASAPASNTVRFYGDLSGGRDAIHTRSDSHRASLIQSHLGRVRPILATAQGDSTAIDFLGTVFSVSGVATAAVTDPSTFIGGQRRVDVLRTGASSTNVVGLYTTQAQFWRGNAAGSGGFYIAFRWGVATGQASTTRGFCGLTSGVAAPTDANPSGLADVFGMGWDAGDTDIQIMHRTGTGTVQKYSLSHSVWPKPTSDNQAMYQFEIYCPPNGSGIGWRIEDLVSGAVDFDTYFTDIPADNTMLAPRIYQSVGGVSSVIGITFMNLYAEQDM